MDHINCYGCGGESGSVAEFVAEPDLSAVIRGDSSGENPDNNNSAVSGYKGITVITGGSGVEIDSVSDSALTRTLDVAELTTQMTSMPTPRCTTFLDPESITTTTAAAAAAAAAGVGEASLDSMQPRECQTRSLTQLFHLTATLNEHFRLSLTRMEKKLDEVVRKVSEMEEAMQEWKEGQKSNDTGEKEKEEGAEKDEEGKKVVQEERKSGSDDEEHEVVRSWEKWLPSRTARQMKKRIDQNGLGRERKAKEEGKESSQSEEKETFSSKDTWAVPRTEELVGDGSEKGREAQSQTVEDTFRLNESEKKEIKKLHDVTTQTPVSTATDLSPKPPQPVQTYHINISDQCRASSSPVFFKVSVTTKELQHFQNELSLNIVCLNLSLSIDLSARWE